MNTLGMMVDAGTSLSLLTRHVRQARENEARLEKACLASVGTDFDLHKTCQNKTNQPTYQPNKQTELSGHVLIISVLGETKMSECLQLIGPASLAYLVSSRSRGILY